MQEQKTPYVYTYIGCTVTIIWGISLNDTQMWNVWKRDVHSTKTRRNLLILNIFNFKMRRIRDFWLLLRRKFSITISFLRQRNWVSVVRNFTGSNYFNTSCDPTIAWSSVVLTYLTINCGSLKGTLQQCPCCRRVRHRLGGPFDITIRIPTYTVFMVEWLAIDELERIGK